MGFTYQELEHYVTTWINICFTRGANREVHKQP